MKLMTCLQLGGACDKKIHANTFEEIAEGVFATLDLMASPVEHEMSNILVKSKSNRIFSFIAFSIKKKLYVENGL